MFGLSFSKLLLLALLIGVVWYGWKYFQRVETVRRNIQEELQRRRAAASGNPRDLPAEDLVKCSVCGDYMPSSSHACGRPNCPWPR